MRALEVGLYNSFGSVGWLLIDMGRHKPFTEALNTAKADHAEARRLLEEVANRLHHPSERRSRLWRFRSGS